MKENEEMEDIYFVVWLKGIWMEEKKTWVVSLRSLPSYSLQTSGEKEISVEFFKGFYGSFPLSSILTSHKSDKSKENIAPFLSLFFFFPSPVSPISFLSPSSNHSAKETKSKIHDFIFSHALFFLSYRWIAFIISPYDHGFLIGFIFNMHRRN